MINPNKSGGIPWFIFDDIPKVLLMIPSNPIYGGKYPQIAKGNIDILETPIMAAVREIEEETGILRDNIDFNFTYKITNDPFHIFSFKVIDPYNLAKFHYETKEVLWLSEDNISKMRDIHRAVISKTFQYIKSI